MSILSRNQTFADCSNASLLRSCLQGLPIRVVRSSKSAHSRFAPSAVDAKHGLGFRYDGVYKIAACWRRPCDEPSPDGNRYLKTRFAFVRCDNAPAPWEDAAMGSSDLKRTRFDETGREDTHDSLPAAVQDDMRKAVCCAPREEAGGAPRRGGRPLPRVTYPNPALQHWAYDVSQKKWGWIRQQPVPTRGAARRSGVAAVAAAAAAAARRPLLADKLRREAAEIRRLLGSQFSCPLCSRDLCEPVSLDCSHRFCSSCLASRFSGVDTAEASSQEEAAALTEASGRSLRARAPFARPCPTCKKDCSASLKGAVVNVTLAAVISGLRSRAAEMLAKADREGGETREAVLMGGEGVASAVGGGVRGGVDGEGGDRDGASGDDKEHGEKTAAATAATAKAAVAPVTVAERAAVAASAALAGLRIELGSELAATVPDFFLQEAIDGHDGDLKKASIEVRVTLQAQARAEMKALKEKEKASKEKAAAEAAAAAAAAHVASTAAAPVASSAASAPSRKRKRSRVASSRDREKERGTCPGKGSETPGVANDAAAAAVAASADDGEASADALALVDAARRSLVAKRVVASAAMLAGVAAAKQQASSPGASIRRKRPRGEVIGPSPSGDENGGTVTTKKKKKYRKWTEEPTKVLVNGVQLFGARAWDRLLAEAGGGYLAATGWTSETIRSRWKNLVLWGEDKLVDDSTSNLTPTQAATVLAHKGLPKVKRPGKGRKKKRTKGERRTGK